MKLTWIGHSCFRIEKDGYAVILDPYADGSVPGLASVRETADRVCCSHEHGDHGARETVTLHGSAEAAEGAAQDPKTERIQVRFLETFHDDVRGDKRGPNKITILTDGEKRIAHLGDLGCMPEPEQLEELKGMDAVLIPVGGHYTIDGRQAAELVKLLEPKVVVPMHYRNDAAGFGFDVIGTVEEFTENFTGKMKNVLYLQSCELDLSREQNAQVIVLEPRQKNSTKIPM